MRDKAVAKLLGETWHEIDALSIVENPDFTTWEGFGVMWEQAQKMEWWEDFKQWAYMGTKVHMHAEQDGSISANDLLAWDVKKIYNNIHPTRFRDALYDYGVDAGLIGGHENGQSG